MRIALLLLLVACSPKTGGSAALDATTADAAPLAMSTVYSGMLDKTAPVTFGGGTFCTYTITLTSLQASISVLPSGDISEATVQDVNVEATVGSCPYTVTPPSLAKYSLTSAKPTSTGNMLTLAGDPANVTGVSLDIELAAQGTQQVATATFKRTDQVAMLDWIVTTHVTLTPP